MSSQKRQNKEKSHFINKLHTEHHWLSNVLHLELMPPVTGRITAVMNVIMLLLLSHILLHRVFWR
ncbi:hypothetical protein, partial [Escherichia coli]|uniref:hypothetical protein n=1 Tax=Escherichia coli TaxID=562 RepID=UPI0020BDFD43